LLAINASIALLTDGNDDTFPVYTLAKNLGYVFDFGPRFKLSATAFALEGRLNFADRATDTAFFGSNDGTTWTQLTVPIKGLPVELTKVAVKPELVRERFRYLKLQKGGGTQGGLFEPAELRIYGQRYETR
jgi:large repetitive protein